ncbi:MAG: hypothetical protein AB1700_18290, partial [Bacillota bacterium]
RWTDSTGMGGRFESERVDDFTRNTQYVKDLRLEYTPESLITMGSERADEFIKTELGFFQAVLGKIASARESGAKPGSPYRPRKNRPAE